MNAADWAKLSWVELTEPERQWLRGSYSVEENEWPEVLATDDGAYILAEYEDDGFQAKREAKARAKAKTVADQVQQLERRAEAKRLFDARTAPPVATLDAEYLTRDQIASLPPAQPLIEGVLGRHNYAILAGRDSTFKSFVALDWSLSLASGRPWVGRKTEAIKVLYVAAEGAYGIDARINAWEQEHGQIDPQSLILRTSPVDLQAGGPAFEHLLNKVSSEKVGLVVIDTLRKSSGSATENSSEMGIVIDNLDIIKRTTHNGSVLVLAHTNKGDNDTRGFSAIEDDADVVWRTRVTGIGASKTVTLRNTKQKDGPNAPDIAMKLIPLHGSVVLKHDNRVAPGPVAFPQDPEQDDELRRLAKAAGVRPDTQQYVLLAALVELGGSATRPSLMAHTSIGSSSADKALKGLVEKGAVAGQRDKGEPQITYSVAEGMGS